MTVDFFNDFGGLRGSIRVGHGSIFTDPIQSKNSWY